MKQFIFIPDVKTHAKWHFEKAAGDSSSSDMIIN
jgi:hypothetical protein